ncbi:MAG TPA: ABC transporter permease [Gemmatimonadaceae bacterium]|jgi:putative ABC transport system permease protein|nr:ABC transporter permease [Gemmatimonadaceae bacterium]
MLLLLLALTLQGGARTIAIDERLAADAGLRVGDRVVVAAEPATAGGVRAAGDTVVIGAIVRRRADPSEIARGEYRVRLHLDHLQRLTGYGDRVDRFAVQGRGDSGTVAAMNRINEVAFGFRAHRSRDIAVETSRTFAVVSRFHRAIGVITIVASAVFLLCILLLKVEERRRDVAALRLLGISRRSVARSLLLEAMFVAGIGSALGVGIGALASRLVNSYYQGVYRTPLRFSIVTPDIVALAVALSLVLGAVVGALAARRLVRAHPLSLLGR